MSGAAAVQEPEELEEAEGQYEFDQAFQLKIATHFLRDTQFAMRTKDLIKPEYFTEDAVKAVIRIGQKFVADYKSAPDRSILPMLLKDAVANKQIRDDMKEPVKDVIRHVISSSVNLAGSAFVIDKVSTFARHTAMEQAILQSVGLLEKGDFAGIDKIMKAAQAVGASGDTGEYDYWKENESRTKLREDYKAGKIVKEGVSTGVSEVDAHLYHGGWGRKELSLIMGAAKAGKSLSLGEFGKNASLLGYNVLYDSCEVACRIIADRIDANLSDTAMRLLKDDPQAVYRKIKAAEAKAGHLKMREHAAGTLKPSQLMRIIENYRAEGIILDLVIVDYADIMAAEYRSDNLIDNMRAIYIDLRAIAFEQNLAMLTATQTNRTGATKHTSKMTDVSEDFNKIRTADVVLGLNATDDEKKSGEARIHWVASRNTEDGFSLRIRQDREKLKFLTKVLGKEL
jgi:replicative DNA helicase